MRLNLLGQHAEGLVTERSEADLHWRFACAESQGGWTSLKEAPDLSRRHLTIRFSTVLRDMARPNQTCVTSVEHLDRFVQLGLSNQTLA